MKYEVKELTPFRLMSIFAYDFIKKGLAEKRADLLSMLLAAHLDEAEGAGLTLEQIRDEVMTLFIAGHETTANAIVWTFYLLAQHPEVEAKLQAELEQLLGGRLPTAEDTRRLKYTRAVLSEAMRLYPPAWAVGRLAVEDDEVGFAALLGELAEGVAGEG